MKKIIITFEGDRCSGKSTILNIVMLNLNTLGYKTDKISDHSLEVITMTKPIPGATP